MFAGMPAVLHSIDTTEGWYKEGQQLIVKGKVFRRDEKTTAPNTILYYYHTDRNGHYTAHADTPSRAGRHGYLRGWVKTDDRGNYAIYTSRPAQYPGGQFEAHIHVYVKEPDMDHPYWIDAWIFDDDPLVTADLKQRLENRGGSGILSTRTENGVLTADHDVILGLNIPGYPE
jgi:protocatechuate 3,4-dioxygenase beta subunit